LQIAITGFRRRLAASLCFVFAACAVAVLAGCSKTTARRLYETQCGAGKLVLELKVVTHSPAPSEVKFTLCLVADGQRRVVDVLKPRATLWARPAESERFTRLRPGLDNWPIFVSPASFTPAEFDQIRERLQATHDEFNAAAAQSRTGVSGDYGADVQLSSIRYVDYDGFRRSYSGPQSKVTVAVYPDGGVWLNHPNGTCLMGNVVEGGRKVIVAASVAKTPVPKLSDPLGYLLAATDKYGKRIIDEFAFEKLPNSQYEAMMANERAERTK
jgi:hypothetical protein